MVLTPTQRPSEPSNQPSPLILPVRPGLTPHTHPSRASSSHTISPPLSATSLPPLRRFSTSSFSKLSDFHLDSPLDEDGHLAAEPSPLPSRQGSYTGPSRQASSLSLNGENSGVKGVRYTDLSLDAGEWRHPVFKQKVLAILRKLRVPLWNAPNLLPSYIHLQKVSGALTNAVFFLSFNPSRRPTSPSMSPLLTPTMPPSDPDLPLHPEHFPPTLLLRIYGPSSDALISRTEELRILHVLSTQYGLGPTVFGTFENGRVEQFFPSRALTADELRQPLISRGIARRMRELHHVDLQALGYDEGKAGTPIVWKCLTEWAPAASEVLNTLGGYGGRWEMWVETFGLHRLGEEIRVYKEWVMQQPVQELVFSHNDTQYGNLLLLDAELPKGMPDHHRYIVIDFEYAAPNPRGYDLANHFHEWRANYHHPTLSHSLQPHYPYPSPAERENFYRAYLSISLEGKEEILRKRKDVEQDLVDALEREVRIWSPACSVFWALWGIIQAEEHVGKMVEEKDWKPDFDYLSYAMERLEMFRKEARELGVPLPDPR